MTKQEIYEQIVQLTSELHATNVAEKIFSAAKEGDPKKVEEVFETFEKEYPDLYARIVELGEEFEELQEKSVGFINPCIFGTEEDASKGIYVLNTDKIDSVSLYVLMFLADIDDFNLFAWDSKSTNMFTEAIFEAGYQEIADFIFSQSWTDMVGEDEGQYPTLYELLVAIFRGEFSDEE